jgi:hydroxymethylbilane synthase
VDTRLRKLDDGEYDAIILATAGLKRLGLKDRITERIETTVSLPAAGQGAVGIECRSDADDIRQLLDAISHERTSLCVHAERLVSTGLGANCNLPIGAFARIDGETFHINGFVGDGSDAGSHIRSAKTGNLSDAMALAQAVTDDLLSQGAADLIPEE